MYSEPAVAAAAAAPAGVLRRPVGPRSRRPPTHAGTGGARRMQDAALEDATEAAADLALSPLREEASAEEADQESAELYDGIDDCAPAAEKQEEEERVDKSAAVPRRPLPRGAVPLLILPPGGVGFALKPRLARTPRPATTMDTVDGPTDCAAASTPAATSPVTAPAALETSLSPKLRQSRPPPPGAGPPMIATTDLAAIRLQLRRAASPQPAAAPAPAEESAAHPPSPPQPPLLRSQPPLRPPPPSLQSLPPPSPPPQPPPPPQPAPPQLPPKPLKRRTVKVEDRKE